MSNNLYLFPSISGTFSGYSIAVKSDIGFFKPDDNDYVIYIQDKKVTSKDISHNVCFLKRNNILFRICNLLSTGHPSFFSGIYLYLIIRKNFKRSHFHKVIVGDVNFFNLLMYLKYDSVEIRLHNFYLKMINCLLLYPFRLSYLRMYYQLYVGSLIEKKIVKFSEINQSIIYFISNEEKEFALKYNVKIQAKVLSVNQHEDASQCKVNPAFNWDGNFIWFGGLSSHKLIGVKYFIREIYSSLFKSNNNINFLLFGKGSDKINNKGINIKGFGYVESFSFEKYRNSIFVNPDIIGGGQKIKLLKLYKENLFCLSTELGIEGFSYSNQWDLLKAVHINNWNNFLSEYVANYIKQAEL